MRGQRLELAAQMAGVMHPRQHIALDLPERREGIKTKACEQGEHGCLVVELLQELRHRPHEPAERLDEKAAEQERGRQGEIGKDKQHGEGDASGEAIRQPAPIVVTHQIGPEDRPQPSNC